jgi:hypothetical protein
MDTDTAYQTLHCVGGFHESRQINPKDLVVDKPLALRRRQSDDQLLIDQSESFQTWRIVVQCSCKRPVKLGFDRSNTVRECEQEQGFIKKISKPPLQTQVLRNYRADKAQTSSEVAQSILL